MGYTTPNTVSGSDTLTAALWNTQIRDNMEWLRKPPACQVYRNASTAYTSGAISFTTSAFDNDAMWSAASPSRVTIKTAGIYLIQSYLVVNGVSAAQGLQTTYYLNGTIQLAQTEYATSNLTLSCSASAVMDLAVNDYIEVMAAHSGTNSQIVGASNPLLMTNRSRLNVAMISQKS